MVDCTTLALLQRLAREAFPLATCLAHGSKAPARRGFLSLIPESFPWATAVAADFSAGYGAHPFLALTLKAPRQQTARPSYTCARSRWQACGC
eukprot:15431779-Alexandrium_andersonii.AAC.1